MAFLSDFVKKDSTYLGVFAYGVVHFKDINGEFDRIDFKRLVLSVLLFSMSHGDEGLSPVPRILS